MSSRSRATAKDYQGAPPVDQPSRDRPLTSQALAIEQLVGPRDSALLIGHHRDDREVPFIHGERLAATWQNATLRATSGLGHRRILRDDAVIANVVEFVRQGAPPPVSDLVREVDRMLAQAGV